MEALFNSVAETYEDTIIPVISYQVDLSLFVYACIQIGLFCVSVGVFCVHTVAETYQDTIIPVISYQVYIGLFVYTYRSLLCIRGSLLCTFRCRDIRGHHHPRDFLSGLICIHRVLWYQYFFFSICVGLLCMHTLLG